MRIVEIVIDGFKSYAVRTVISGWDESFNSITGLNGSGKSNILDSICFVLGITNMSTVRAQNLQDLIYKRGQAGVTKASVSIVFDNRDKKKSPIGFEEYATISVTRQIVLGGTSKYLINGHRAQQQTVQNLFQSVQLNINNPNFLIMQGKITKVLNMKPVEILAMIEEAAGTRMFEDRRDKALKTMAKKELKLQELRELLKDEIEPKLEKLRTEKRAFLDFQQTQNDLERLTRLVVAYDYTRCQEKLKQSAADLEDKQQRQKHLEDATARLRSEICHLQEDADKIRAQWDEELRKGGKAQALEMTAKKHANELVRLATVMDLKKTSLGEEGEKKASMDKAVGQLEALLKVKTEAFDKAKATYDAAKDDLAKQRREVDLEEELWQTLQTGVASKNGGETGGYQSQLQDARNRATAAATEQQQAKIKMAHLKSRLKEEEPRADKAKQQNAGLLRDIDGLSSQAQQLEAQMQELGIEPGQQEVMLEQESLLQHRVRALRDDADKLRRQVAKMDFRHADPIPSFDRSKVKGLVAQLLTLDEEHSRAATALEICAGGRLYNVVVDSQVTGTQLLQKGKLRKRVTIIPLNNIAAFKASAETISTAKTMAPGKVDLALSLVGYDDEMSAAMEYVFGNTLICADAPTAKLVTFDARVRMRSITLEGDAYDPSGTLSGGSAAGSTGVLVTLQRLKGVSKQLEEAQGCLGELQARMRQQKPKLDQARLIQQQLDVKNHEVKLAREQMKGNSSSSIIQEVDKMTAEIAELQESMAQAKRRQSEASADVKRIEKDMADFDSNKDAKLVELQESLDRQRAEVEDKAGAVKCLHKELRGAQLDVEQVCADLGAVREQLHEAEAGMEAQEREVEELAKQRSELTERHEAVQGELDEERAKLHLFDDELRALDEAMRTKNARIAEDGLEKQKLGHQMERLHKEQQGAAEKAARLEREHGWIEEEKDKFGRGGTAYDCEGRDMGDSKATLRNLTERFQGLKKKINPKVMNMIDSVEKKEVSLKHMIKTVIRDKRKIEETIASLDEYKAKALQETWERVNGDFGHTFAELLPGGSFAQLDPPEGRTIGDGLEVRVCLGKVWKQSLAELSGGQRSLVALSLIMALLQFKPAPMYILDEIDAALDLSHTQNIGRLIKTRFKGSQFIVVSLKDGMFQNANRIFRTRFSEGTSMVQALTPADLG